MIATDHASKRLAKPRTRGPAEPVLAVIRRGVLEAAPAGPCPVPESPVMRVCYSFAHFWHNGYCVPAAVVGSRLQDNADPLAIARSALEELTDLGAAAEVGAVQVLRPSG